MKIVAISDTHGYLPELPQCDVVVIAGDIIPLHIQKQYESSIAWLSGPFQDWALNLNCEKVIFIAGNHDFVFEKLWRGGDYATTDPHWSMYNNPILMRNLLFQLDDQDNPKIIYLQDSEVTYKGVKFYGTPWCPELRNWAFYQNSEGLKEKFLGIPFDTDVLLTHCPPKFGQQGVVLETNWNFGSNFGCQELQDALENVFKFKSGVTHILSGHIHSGNHNIETHGGLAYRNVSLLNENYEVAYKPFEFEIE
jgi:Icc-related predicted phosphoesterase